MAGRTLRLNTQFGGMEISISGPVLLLQWFYFFHFGVESLDSEHYQQDQQAASSNKGFEQFFELIFGVLVQVSNRYTHVGGCEMIDS